MKKIIIGLISEPGAGKGLASRRLCEQHAFTRVRFADVPRRMLGVLGLTVADIDGPDKHLARAELGGNTPHQLLRTLVDEWGRWQIHSDLWVNAWLKEVGPAELVVVDDIKRPNEAAAVRVLGGHIWRIHRPNLPQREQVRRQDNLIEPDLTLVNNHPEELMELVSRHVAPLLDPAEA